MAKREKSKKKPPARRPQAARPEALRSKSQAHSSKPAKVRTQAPTFPATIFTVTNEQLGRLAPSLAVESLRDILWADARQHGIATTSINVSAWLDVPDGGIDARVSAGPATLKGSAIKHNRMGFQVKAGTGFQPWKESHIRAELFGD